jgi:hypothetical protein
MNLSSMFPGRITLVLAACVSFQGCASHAGNSSSPPLPELSHIDHIILSIDDLERGMDLLEQSTGVRPVFGGAHPGRGTRNALLSLGNNQYIELLAPNPADTSAAVKAASEKLKKHFSQFKTPTPNGWAVRVTDADAERARLVAAGFKASAVSPGSRAKPDGQVLRWKTFDPWGIENELLPFAIEWGAGTKHPSTTSPTGCKLAEFSMVSTSPDSISALFAKAGYPLSIRPGARDQLGVVLECPRGRVRFP